MDLGCRRVSVFAMDRQEIRSAFEEMCGPQVYERFLQVFQATSRWKGRLLFWQEELWEQFCASRPQAPPAGFDALLELFDICPVHRVELQRDVVPRVYGTLVRDLAYERLERLHFPCARVMSYGPCWRLPGDPSTAAVDYCTRCRANHAAWSSGSWRTQGFPFAGSRSPRE